LAKTEQSQANQKEYKNVSYSGSQVQGKIVKSRIDSLEFAVRAFAFLSAAICLLGVSTPLAAFGASTPAVLIKMSDKPPKFLPEKVTIKAGQTIEWVNNAKTLHSVDGDPTMALKPSDVSLPPGAKPFDSGFMKPGMTWEYTFKVPGTYKYTCVPHEKDRMNGEIVVK
jgi:plastocyanin